MKDRTTPEEDDEAKRPGFLVRAELRVLDQIIDYFQRLRNRVEPPVDAEESSRDRRTKPHEDAVPAPDGDAPPRRRVPAFLVNVMVLLVGGISGMSFSYHLLSKVADSNAVVIDYLHEQVMQLEKEDARSANTKDKYLRKIAEHEKEIQEYRDAIDAYQNQVDDLRLKLKTEESLRQAGAGSTGRQAPAGRGNYSPPARKQPPVREKTKTCVTGSQNTAANLAQCMDDFNRK